MFGDTYIYFHLILFKKFLYYYNLPLHWLKSKSCCRISPKENTKDRTCEGHGLIIKWQSTALTFSTLQPEGSFTIVEPA